MSSERSSWMNLLQDVADSRLDRVIAVGQTQELDGVLVELTAIEVREGGAFLFLRARPVNELNLMSADVQIADDQGTTYQTWLADHEGSALHWSGRSMFTPAPPRGASLIVEILSFGPPIGQPIPRGVSTKRVAGPWRFVVEA